MYIYWHAVVRDYTLAMLGSEKLVALQRSFVKELLGSQSSWEQVSSEKVPKGKELDFFMSGGALQWHIASAWQAPLVEDVEACGWLAHESEIVRSNALQAVPLCELEGLADAYVRRGNHLQAAKLLYWALNACTMPKLEQLKYCSLCFAALDQIANKGVVERALEASLLPLLLWGLAKMGSPEWKDAMTRAVQMHKSGVELDAYAM